MDKKSCVLALLVLCTVALGTPVDNLWRHLKQVKRQNVQDIRFLGAGYDLMKGNPDGDIAAGSVTDPGLKPSRKILKVSFEDGSAIKVDRNSCLNKEDIYENNESYQKKLQNEISVSGSASYMGFSFTASAGFAGATDQTTTKKTIVYEKNELCALGIVRYKMELVPVNKYTITDSFASDICALPFDYDTGKSAYMEYLTRWGTHTVTELELGTRNIERKTITATEAIKYAEQQTDASMEVSGSYGAASGSLSVDIGSFKSENSFKSLFQSSLISYNVGTKELPEPIKLHLMEVTEALDPKYWSHLDTLVSKGTCQASFSLANAVAQLKKALNDYPAYLQVGAVTDDPVTIPLLWPLGTYGLLKPRLACAQSGSGDNSLLDACPEPTWFHGRRFQDTENNNNENSLSSGSCLEVHFSYLGIQLEFCMQHEASGEFRRTWPKGTYCIYKLGDCPEGFTEGAMYQDDEDDNNMNSHSGYLPEGSFSDNTGYGFCCREDAFTTRKIFLPIGIPFYLIARNDKCQQVHSMSVTQEFVYFDNEDDDNHNTMTGMAPYNPDAPRNTKLILCYYQRM